MPGISSPSGIVCPGPVIVCPPGIVWVLPALSPPDEPRAVEAARRGAAPGVGDTEVAHRDRDDARVVACRIAAAETGPAARWRRIDTRTRGDALARLGLQPRLARPLRRLDSGDLGLDRAEQALPLGELTLNRRPLRRPLGYERRLAGLRLLQLGFPTLHLASKAANLAVSSSPPPSYARRAIASTRIQLGPTD